MKLDYPPRPEGNLQAQLLQLWDWLFRTVEKINAEE